jgi:hypothetical protein
LQVRKLTYLQMIGYNVSWASFCIVEVMSQHRFAHKRIGYLAANQVSFNLYLHYFYCLPSYICFAPRRLMNQRMLSC